MIGIPLKPPGTSKSIHWCEVCTMGRYIIIFGKNIERIESLVTLYTVLKSNNQTDGNWTEL